MPNAAAIIVDGCNRARDAVRHSIEAEVAAEFAGRLAAANWLQRLQLRREIRREAAVRMERLAPERGLY